MWTRVRRDREDSLNRNSGAAFLVHCTPSINDDERAAHDI